MRWLSHFESSWWMLGVLLVLLALFTRKLVRTHRAMSCPTCNGDPEWADSGSRDGVDYRYYNCKCGARLVKETYGAMQLREHWVPGSERQKPPSAKVR